MKIISVIGTRPQYIKLGAFHRACVINGISHSYIDTGQHYSPELSSNICKELGLPGPRINLNVRSENHIEQISEMMKFLDKAISRIEIDFMLVYGDTNSTLAASLVAHKKSIPTGHIEAGLRSFNKAMPEELNRVLTDHCSTRLYAPTFNALVNLKKENLKDRAIYTGDLMVESLEYILNLNQESTPMKYKYYLATLHRHENMKSPDLILNFFESLAQLPENVIVLAHPHLLKRMISLNVRIANNIIISEAKTHSETVRLLVNSEGLITDSGGLQKEAFMLGIVCTTVRNEVEWIETLDSDWNVLCRDIKELPALVTRKKPVVPPKKYFGEGKASNLIIEDIAKFIS